MCVYNIYIHIYGHIYIGNGAVKVGEKKQQSVWGKEERNEKG